MNYIVCGIDDYLVKKEIEKIKAEYTKNYFVEETVIDMEKYSIFQLINEVNTIPFGTDYRIFTLAHANFLSSSTKLEDDQQEFLLDYFRNPNPTSICILVPDGNLDQRKALVKELRKHCDCRVIAEINFDTFKSEIRQDLSKHNIVLKADALEELYARIPLDYYSWHNELAKLVNYPNEITVEVVKKLTTRSLFGTGDKDGLLFTNDLLAKNMDKVLSKWRDMCITSADPYSLIGLIASQFRFLFQVKLLMEKRMSQNAIAQQLSAHEYRVTKTVELLGKYQLNDILEILYALAELDNKIKRGIVEPKAGFEMFLFNATRSEVKWSH